MTTLPPSVTGTITCFLIMVRSQTYRVNNTLSVAVSGTAISAPSNPPNNSVHRNTDTITVTGCNPTASPTIRGAIKNPSRFDTIKNAAETITGCCHSPGY